MAEACFTARVTTRAQFKGDILKLNLQKNDNGRYQHEEIVTFVNVMHRVIKLSYNPSNPGNGMMKLLDSITSVLPSEILAINSNDVATIATILATSTHEAAAGTAALVPGAARITFTITTRTEAQDEANHLNLNCQAFIGAKSCAATAITDKVGSDVINIVLRTANVDNFKGINE